MKVIRIGTRASKLALWQAYHVAGELQKVGLDTEIVKIETKGDKILSQALSKIGGKGLFTEELETALREKAIDIAVHSAKDMPASLPEDLPILAFTKREAVNDVIVSLNSNKILDENADFVVGTSSVRRTALLKHYYPKVSIVDMRGNLQTRMKKLENKHCDVLLLAYAGVHRMGYDSFVTTHLPPEIFTPAVGQGSLAIQVSSSMEKPLQEKCSQALSDEAATLTLTTERSFLQTLEGGCSIPAFGLASIHKNEVTFNAGVISLDGCKIIRHQESAPIDKGYELGEKVASKILHNGGKEILATIKS